VVRLVAPELQLRDFLTGGGSGPTSALAPDDVVVVVEVFFDARTLFRFKAFALPLPCQSHTHAPNALSYVVVSRATRRYNNFMVALLQRAARQNCT